MAFKTSSRVTRSSLGLAAAVCIVLAGPSSAQIGAAGARAVAILLDAQGKEHGRAYFVGSLKGLAGSISVKGLTPGLHGMHVHDVGKCVGPDFASAGGHMNLMHRQHGLKNPMGAHEGDMPELRVGADGRAEQHIWLRTSFAPIADYDGAALVIHEGPDDQMTDPSGNSGARVLCGVFLASQ